MRNALIGMAVAILLCAAVGTAESHVNAGAAAEQQVIIENFHFAPATVTIPAGTKVTWVNRDDAPHKVASSDKKFAASPVLDTGDLYGFRFMEPGTYDYFCSLHPKMTGRIVVR